MTGALDRLGEFALFLRAHRGDARGNDLAALGDEALKQADVLVIDPGCILRGEGAALAAAEKRACHVFCLPYLRSRRRPPSRSLLDRKRTRLNSSHYCAN